MRKIMVPFVLYAFMAVMVLDLTGCTIIFQKGRRKDVAKISKLKSKLTELERAKVELENRLSKEIDDHEVRVEMLERGLVITFVAEILFSSGKDILREGALSRLGKVAQVLNTTVLGLDVGVEGHTDNIPIKYSRWKSNWELSAARAMSVVHYLVDEHGADPSRISATGFGEYHSIASNDTQEGRQKNRRIEILPAAG